MTPDVQYTWDNYDPTYDSTCIDQPEYLVRRIVNKIHEFKNFF